MAAAASVLDADGSETVKEPIGDSLLEAGQWIRGIESGGGGYGDPLDREPAAVLKDVLERWVSAEAAHDVYGIVLVEDGAAGGFTVDEQASAQRRESLRAGGVG
jgi:N-methylhydantoinase B